MELHSHGPHGCSGHMVRTGENTVLVQVQGTGERERERLRFLVPLVILAWVWDGPGAISK